MAKKIRPFILLVQLNLLVAVLFAQKDQTEKPTLYHPEVDANVQIRSAIEKAATEGKHVFLMVGGNWCGWCIRFHAFCGENAGLDSLINANFEVEHINYSRENQNKDVLASLGYPQRFGFPVFVILDGEGKRIHTQDSGLLEGEGGYDLKNVERFFQSWSPAAIDPEKYE